MNDMIRRSPEIVQIAYVSTKTLRLIFVAILAAGKLDISRKIAVGFISIYPLHGEFRFHWNSRTLYYRKDSLSFKRDKW